MNKNIKTLVEKGKRLRTEDIWGVWGWRERGEYTYIKGGKYFRGGDVGGIQR